MDNNIIRFTPKIEAEHVMIDGVAWYKFDYDCEYKGQKWCFDFYAINREDAEARFQAIKDTAHNLKRIEETIVMQPNDINWDEVNKHIIQPDDPEESK